MAQHQYAKCTSKTCDTCNGTGEQQHADGARECDFCGGSGRSRCTGCRAEGLDCWYESLSFCEVCGGMEGSLLPECPGVRLSQEEHDANYQHYCAGTGPFRQQRLLQDVTSARVFAERYYAEDVGSMPPERSGARRFYDAVNELWQWVHDGCPAH